MTDTFPYRLAEVYVKATSDVKRVILRLMEAPIKQLGMQSTELLQFIKNSPKGSETLVLVLLYARLTNIVCILLSLS